MSSARQLIDRDGWDPSIAHAYAANPDGFKRHYEALEAAVEAELAHEIQHGGFDDLNFDDDDKAALHRMAQRAGGTYDEALLEWWNDRPWREQRDVLALFDSAIARLRAEVG